MRTYFVTNYLNSTTPDTIAVKSGGDSAVAFKGTKI